MELSLWPGHFRNRQRSVISGQWSADAAESEERFCWPLATYILRAPLEPKRKHPANFAKWRSVGCALVLMCASASPAMGQGTAADSKTGSGAKARTVHSTPARGTATKATTAKSTTAKSKTASNSTKPNSNRHTRAIAKNSRTGSASARSHAATHLSASQRTKSNTATGPHGKSAYASSRKVGNNKTGNKRTTARGQQKIDSERAQAIQEALIREHYLGGEPAGTWNESSEDAMRRYQADHGWQSKVVPDSRALISLGLGPSHDHLLNPESAMTTEPAAPHAESLTPTSHSADPGAHLNTTPVAPVGATPAENPPKPQ
jgi:hypothetical protein